VIAPAYLRDGMWARKPAEWGIQFETISYAQLRDDRQLGGQSNNLALTTDEYQLVVIDENLSRDHSFVMDRVLRGAVRNLVEDGEHYKSVKAAGKWYDWPADVGEVVRAPERRELDMEATVAHEQTETEEYVLIPDNEDL